MASGFANMQDGLLTACRDTFAVDLTITRGSTTIAFEGIIDRVARTEPVGPGELPIEGFEVHLGVKIADLGILGIPQHGDIVVEADGTRWSVSRVDVDIPGGVKCKLLEPEEVEA